MNVRTVFLVYTYSGLAFGWIAPGLDGSFDAWWLPRDVVQFDGQASRYPLFHQKQFVWEIMNSGWKTLVPLID